MRKLKMIGIGLLLGAFFASCTTSHTVVLLDNPVGSKRGKSTFTIFNPQYSYEDALNNGNISKAGIAETKAKVFIVPWVVLTVTGE